MPPIMRFSTILFAVLAAVTPPLAAQDVGRLPLESFTLDNGLQVVLAPDHAVQVVGVSIWYDVGSRDDPPGRAGLARLFERLMFDGSTRLTRGAHAGLVEQAGGEVRAEVGVDVARFGETLPSNRLSLGLWLEAERLRGLDLKDSLVAGERAALLQAYGREVADQPYTAAITDAVAALADTGLCPGYAHPPVGRPQEIAAITLADAASFALRFFQPGNARLVVAGDFDPTAARGLVQDYFGGIARGETPVRPACALPAAPAALRRAATDRLASRPAVGLFYRIPAPDHPDAAALELLNVVLAQGTESRLARTLGGEHGPAAATQGGVLDQRRAAGVFSLFAVAAEGVTPDSLERGLLRVAAEIATEEVGAAELTRARNIYLATAVGARQRAGEQAEVVQRAAALDGGVETANSRVSSVLRVTAEDLRRVARSWLRPENALTLVVTPEAGS